MRVKREESGSNDLLPLPIDVLLVELIDLSKSSLYQLAVFFDCLRNPTISFSFIKVLSIDHEFLRMKALKDEQNTRYRLTIP